MRLSRILYCIVPLSLLLLIGCSNYSEQQVNGLYYQALELFDLGLYDQSLETLDLIIKQYPKSEMAVNLVQGTKLIKGYTYKVFKNTFVPSCKANNDVHLIGRALDIYAEDNMVYPTKEQGLNALIIRPTLSPKPKNWRGPYIKRTNFNDPWGNPYRFKLILKYLDRYECDVYSRGPDGKDGSGDEIHR
jgi:type II secretion system protein G